MLRLVGEETTPLSLFSPVRTHTTAVSILSLVDIPKGQLFKYT